MLIAKSSLFIALVLMLVPSQVGAQTETNEERGQKLFLTHCAACHGEDGRGQGTVAAAMKMPPSDLRQISKRRDGKFPHDEIRTIITGLKLESVHGSRAMPVWGRIFTQMEATEYGRINVLMSYLHSIQEK